MADLLALRLDPVAARHLTRALEVHRRWCRDNGVRLPAALSDLALLATAGQGTTNGHGAEELADDGHMSPLVYTYAEAAERLRVSERTVQRLVAEGRLPAVEVGTRNPRIAVEDLENYVAQLRAPTEEVPA